MKQYIAITQIYPIKNVKNKLVFAKRLYKELFFNDTEEVIKNMDTKIIYQELPTKFTLKIKNKQSPTYFLLLKLPKNVQNIVNNLSMLQRMYFCQWCNDENVYDGITKLNCWNCGLPDCGKCGNCKLCIDF